MIGFIVKDMCGKCRKKTFEIEKLNQRETLYKIETRNLYNINTPVNGHFCDLCLCTINLRNNFYSVCDCDGRNSYDICLNCYETNNDAKKIVETKSMDLIDVNDKSNYYFNYTGFGSMLYWFPIISVVKGWCRVFMNLNPDDINYRKICLQSCDCRGIFGYFIITDEKYHLQLVLQKLKEICDKGT